MKKRGVCRGQKAGEGKSQKDVTFQSLNQTYVPLIESKEETKVSERDVETQTDGGNT